MRRKAETKAAATGGSRRAEKKPWWQAELDAGEAQKRTSKAEDDLAAYREEVRALDIEARTWKHGPL